MKEKILILYHSGAGSTKLTSEILTTLLSDKFDVTLQHIDNDFDYKRFYDYSLLIFGFPTYHCEPSTSIMDFISKIPKSENKIKIFFFTSFGLYTGNCSKIFYQEMSSKNFTILDYSEFRSPASDGVLMLPSNINFLFNFEKNYTVHLKSFTLKIKAYKTLEKKKKPIYKWYVPLNELAKIYAKKEYDRMKANMHIIENKCTNCNLCVEICERGCWTSSSHIPDFKTENCEFCLKCIHRCSQKAIIFSDVMISKPRLDPQFFKNKKSKYQKICD